MDAPSVEPELRQARSEVSFRALFLGIVMSAVISVATPYGALIVQGTRLGLSSCTPAALFWLFIWVGIANVLVALVHRRWRLSKGELLTIYTMMMVATAIPTRGFTGVTLPMLAGVFYYATPANDWAHLLHPHLPDWMFVRDAEAVKYFYEGLPRGQPIPWNAWRVPLFWWFIFMMAFYVVVLCISSILRRQWADNERLIYPLTLLPLAMVETDERNGALPPLFRNPVMWMGFLIPFLISSINALHLYNPLVPPILLRTSFPIFRRSLTFYAQLNFIMLGFSYFINTNISFSLWFMYFVSVAQHGVFLVLGIQNPEVLGSWTGSGPVESILSHQTTGGIIVFVVFGLWVGRKHLMDVFRKAFRGESRVNDEGEVISFRMAAFGLLGGLLVMGVWLWMTGFPAWVVPLMLAITFIIFIALTRAIVEGGLANITAGVTPCGFLLSGVGVPALGVSGTIAAAYSLSWVGDLLTFMMAPVANGMKLSQEIRGSRRRLFPALLAAMGVSLVGSVVYMLYVAYKYGGVNLHQQYFRSFAHTPAGLAAAKLRNPTGANGVGWVWTFVGAGIMAGLMIARHRLLWWPIHPLGFMVSTSWMIDRIWLSIFLAWLLKTAVLRYGGPKLYRKSRALFLGMILGQIVVGGLWLVVDSFTGMRGNVIHVY